MAKKLFKATARANTAALKNLHIGSLTVNCLFLLSHFLIRSRSLTAWFFLSTPSFACEMILERVGRPSYDASTKALKSSGEDLAAPGLTEYMWDCVWVTWAVAILVILFGNWIWWLWAVIPVYGLYKGFGLALTVKQMAQLGGLGQAADNPPQAAGNRKQRRAAA